MAFEWIADTVSSLYPFRIFDSFSLRLMHLHLSTMSEWPVHSLGSVQNFSEKREKIKKLRQTTNYDDNYIITTTTIRKKRRKTPRLCRVTIFVIQYTCAFKNVWNGQKEKTKMERIRDKQRERERDRKRKKNKRKRKRDLYNRPSDSPSRNLRRWWQNNDDAERPREIIRLVATIINHRVTYNKGYIKRKKKYKR